MYGGYKVQAGAGVGVEGMAGNTGVTTYVGYSNGGLETTANYSLNATNSVFGASAGRGFEGGIYILDAKAFTEASQLSIDTPFGSASLLFNNGFVSGIGFGGPSLGASISYQDSTKDFSKSINLFQGGTCKP